jgi:hypothetical protein
MRITNEAEDPLAKNVSAVLQFLPDGDQGDSAWRPTQKSVSLDRRGIDVALRFAESGRRAIHDVVKIR